LFRLQHSAGVGGPTVSVTVERNPNIGA